MRVLFLTQVLPLPLNAGPKVRAYFVLRYLAEAGHEVSLLSFVRPEDPTEAISSLRRMCHSVDIVQMTRSAGRDVWSGLRSLASGEPFLVVRDQSKGMKQAIERLSGSRSFDAVHADQLWMAPYALSARNGMKAVLDQHNAVFQVARRLAISEKNPLKRWILKREARTLIAFEKETCEQFDHVVWVSDNDLDALRRAGRQGGRTLTRSSVIPICVDPCDRQPIPADSARQRITFLGGMHWPPNAEGINWFIREVWPSVAKSRPDTVLTIIGKNPPRLAPGSFPGKIDTPGFVANLDRYLAESAAFIVPLHSGGGMRVKILDAWCWGLPVISTTIGAEGLKTVHGENVLLADQPASFADATLEVLQNPPTARRLRENGRVTVESHYDWRKVYRSWDSIYCENPVHRPLRSQ